MSSNENLELISLIWLDKMADATQENREIQSKLRSVVNHLRIFDNCHQCEDYIRHGINDKQEKIIFIVSGRLCEEIIERIHDLRQIISIFIFCMDKTKYQLLTEQFKKIRNVIVELDDLLKEINLDCKSEEHKLNESIELLPSKDNIIPLLSQIKSSVIDKRHLLEICSKEYEGNESELENIEEFEHLYSSSNALDYFFNETFLYRLLIKALHIFNIDLLFLLRFFLHDINEQLKQCSTVSVPVYRGQLMNIDQIEFLNQSIDQNYFRFNSFIVAYQNFEEVKKSLENSPNTNGLHRVLFQINHNHIGKEYAEHILFPISTHFSIDSVRFERRIWLVTITVSDSNQQKTLTSIQLAHRLRNQGQFDQAEILFNRLLIQSSSLNSECYDGLGRIAQDKGLYKMSLNFYIKSLETVSSENRGHCLNNIGCVYDYLQEYDKALKYYSQSLTIMTNQIDEAMSHNNIGITYAKNGQHEQAFQSLEYSLAIRKKCLASNDPDLGISYTNIAVLCSSRGQVDRALKYYQRALKIFSLNHFELFQGIVYQNMAQIFQQKNQFDRASNLYQDAKNIFQKLRPIDHPNYIHLQQQIQQLKQNKKQFLF